MNDRKIYPVISHGVDGPLMLKAGELKLRQLRANEPPTYDTWHRTQYIKRVLLKGGRWGGLRVTVQVRGAPYLEFDPEHAIDAVWRYKETEHIEHWPAGWELETDLVQWRSDYAKLGS